MKIIALILFTILVCVSAALETPAQTKVRTRPSAQASPSPTPTPEPAKKNTRSPEGARAASEQASTQRAFDYYWEFTQPSFRNKRIVIRHDVNGKGEIIFERSESDEAMQDPLVVSAIALERINSHLKAMNFLASKTDYQYEKDYSHLGKQTFRYRLGESEREVHINYTTVADMAAVLDEYRKLANQAIWIFDILIARDNHPLDSPGKIDELDSLLKRNEISDPGQMLPFLKEISTDERFPLIARNHAGRLIKKIESGK